MERLEALLGHKAESGLGRRPIARIVEVTETLVRDCETLMDMGCDILTSAPRGVGESSNANESPTSPDDLVIVPSSAEARELLSKRRRK
jgi:hypothetical protein